MLCVCVTRVGTLQQDGLALSSVKEKFLALSWSFGVSVLPVGRDFCHHDPLFSPGTLQSLSGSIVVRILRRCVIELSLPGCTTPPPEKAAAETLAVFLLAADDCRQDQTSNNALSASPPPPPQRSQSLERGSALAEECFTICGHGNRVRQENPNYSALATNKESKLLYRQAAAFSRERCAERGDGEEKFPCRQVDITSCILPGNAAVLQDKLKALLRELARYLPANAYSGGQLPHRPERIIVEHLNAPIRQKSNGNSGLYTLTAVPPTSIHPCPLLPPDVCSAKSGPSGGVLHTKGRDRATHDVEQPSATYSMPSHINMVLRKKDHTPKTSHATERRKLLNPAPDMKRSPSRNKQRTQLRKQTTLLLG